MSMDVDIINSLNSDYNAQNSVAKGLADSKCNSISLPNLFNDADASGNMSNVTISAKDGLSPGDLYAVGRSAANTETKDQALTLTPTKIDTIVKSIERDAKQS